MDSRTIIKAVEAAGWREARQKGSHKQFRHPTKPGVVTIQHPKKDLSIATLKSIERQAGINLGRR